VPFGTGPGRYGAGPGRSAPDKIDASCHISRLLGGAGNAREECMDVTRPSQGSPPGVDCEHSRTACTVEKRYLQKTEAYGSYFLDVVRGAGRLVRLHIGFLVPSRLGRGSEGGDGVVVGTVIDCQYSVNLVFS
jgi:hypothetical protein